MEEFEAAHRWMSPEETLEVFYDTYDREVEEYRKQEPDLSQWMTGGRTTGAQDVVRRRARGAEQVTGYLRYTQASKNRIFLIGGDEPAVEVEFRLDLDGIEVVGFIDLITWLPNGHVGPRDLKTGSKRPDWAFQLGIYRLAIEDLFGFLPSWGDFYIAKDGKPDPPVNLSRFTREFATRVFHDMDKAEKAGGYLPNVGDHCRVCGVSRFCRAAGDRSNEYPIKEVTG